MDTSISSRYDECYCGYEQWAEGWGSERVHRGFGSGGAFRLLRTASKTLLLVLSKVENRLVNGEYSKVDWREHRNVSLPIHSLEDDTGKFEELGIVVNVRHWQGGVLEVALNRSRKITKAQK